MARRSAGLILYRRTTAGLDILLVHPGGPFWAKKDEGVWSIPKGEVGVNEQPLDGARREFKEETGLSADGPFLSLGEVRQNSHKIVLAWAFEGDCNPAALTSISCQMEWPPHSGMTLEFLEIDRGQWFSIDAARAKILSGQAVFLDRLCFALRSSTDTRSS